MRDRIFGNPERGSPPSSEGGKVRKCEHIFLDILTLKADFNELKKISGKLGFFTSGSVNAYKAASGWSSRASDITAIE